MVFVEKEALVGAVLAFGLRTRSDLSAFSTFCRGLIYLIYLFMSRHEVHSMNTHTLQNAG